MADYGYSKVIKSLFYMHAVSADVLDDITLLREQIEDDPQLAISFADTVEYVCQELKRLNTEINTDQCVIYTLSVHDGFNNLRAACYGEITF